jgi:hypothetical protein
MWLVRRIPFASQTAPFTLTKRRVQASHTEASAISTPESNSNAQNVSETSELSQKRPPLLLILHNVLQPAPLRFGQCMDLLRGASHVETMSRRQACEAVVGRLRGAGIPIVMVVDDGDGGLECWCDADPASYRLLVSRGRCPGGTNAKTGKIHRVLWADPGTRVPWEEDCDLAA